MTTKTMKALLALVCLTLTPAWGGSGTYNSGTPDTLHLYVNFETSDEEPRDWEQMFEDSSRLLYELTETQVKIAQVTMRQQCVSAKARADIRIFPGNGAASAVPRGFLNPDTSMGLSQAHNGTTGPVALVHELGHYLFGLEDEYVDQNNVESYCIDRDGKTATIMDSGTTRATERTELCIKKNHRKGHTAQDSKRRIGQQEVEGASGWEWVPAYAAEYLQTTIRPPADRPEKSTAGFGDKVKFDYPGCGIALGIGVDGSGSMSAIPRRRARDGIGPGWSTGLIVADQQKLAPIVVVKQGVERLLRLLKSTDAAGIVWVGLAVDRFDARPMTWENKIAAQEFLSGRKAKGRAGLDEVVSALNRQAYEFFERFPQASRVAVLLSDGAKDEGPSPAEEIARLKELGVVVHVLGFGAGASSRQGQLTRETGGRYLFADSVARAESNFLELAGLLQGLSPIAVDQGLIARNATSVLPILVDSLTGADGLDIFVSWTNSEDELELNLVRPDGARLGAEGLGALTVDDRATGFRHYRIARPEVGDWKLEVLGPRNQETSFAVAAFSRSTALTLAGFTDKSVLRLPENLVIRAALTRGLQSIVGADIKSLVTRPQGNPVPVPLYDDGKWEHGDDRAEDGVYSGIFEQFFGSGSYSVDIKADTRGARAVSPEQRANERADEPQAQEVERAKRTVRFSLVVENAP